MRERRRVHWTAAWLAIVFVAVKAYYLGAPAAPTPHAAWDYVRDLAAVSFVDVLYAAVLWMVASVALLLAGHRPRVRSTIAIIATAIGAASCLYALASVLFFNVFGGFLTYPLLALVGDVHMLRSSVEARVSITTVLALAVLPMLYLALVAGTVRWMPVSRGPWWRPRAVAVAILAVWVIAGQQWFAREWTTRRDRQVAANAQFVFAASWWQAMAGDGGVRMGGSFRAEDLADFEPLRAALARGPLSQARGTRLPVTRRPPNVILIVLESVAARWAGLNHGPYDSTPHLAAESSRGIVFDNFYAHIGRSSNSLASILLSAYPKLGFRDFTEEYPRVERTSLADVFRARGYRTAFMTPSDMGWAGWQAFLPSRGFDEVRDQHALSCSPEVSSWGVEDRCLAEGLIEFIERDPSRPFFAMGWTQQTHHPYEPSPEVPVVDLTHGLEPGPDDYDLNRYLNVLRETDRQLERVFEALRHARLVDDTLVAIVGDHGQAFGYPHESYLQGRTAYEEDMHVPLTIWFPRRYQRPEKSPVVGGHVDLAPTIAELAGVPPAPDWQGRSLFDTEHPPRVYFYVAQDEFKLGVREGSWKYMLDLRAGTDELYDLEHDPDEQQNVATAKRDLCARLRQHLAAWAEANRRQYERLGS